MTPVIGTAVPVSKTTTSGSSPAASNRNLARFQQAFATFLQGATPASDENQQAGVTRETTDSRQVSADTVKSLTATAVPGAKSAPLTTPLLMGLQVSAQVSTAVSVIPASVAADVPEPAQKVDSKMTASSALPETKKQDEHPGQGDVIVAIPVPVTSQAPVQLMVSTLALPFGTAEQTDGTEQSQTGSVSGDADRKASNPAATSNHAKAQEASPVPSFAISVDNTGQVPTPTSSPSPASAHLSQDNTGTPTVTPSPEQAGQRGAANNIEPAAIASRAGVPAENVKQTVAPGSLQQVAGIPVENATHTPRTMSADSIRGLQPQSVSPEIVNTAASNQPDVRPVTAETASSKTAHAATLTLKTSHQVQASEAEQLPSTEIPAKPATALADTIASSNVERASTLAPSTPVTAGREATPVPASSPSVHIQGDEPSTPKPGIAVENPTSTPAQEQQTAFRAVIERAEKPKTETSSQSLEQTRVDIRPSALSEPPVTHRTESASAAPETTAPRTAAGVDQVRELQASDQGHTSSNVISVRLGGNETSEPVDVRFVHRGGQVEMAVRTDNPQMADRLRGNLSELTQNLSDRGFQVDFRDSRGVSTSDRSFSQQQQQQQWSEGRGRHQPEPQQDQQQHRRPRNRPDEEFQFDE